LLRRTGLPERLADTFTGDLEEECEDRGSADGRAAAMAWYWRQVVKSVIVLLWNRVTQRELTSE
jgi:hypothetical protein